MKQTQSNRDNESWKTKVKQTMNKRYGVDNAGQLSDHIEKTSTTLQERYGVKNSLQLPQSRQRMKETIHTPEANLKRNQTNQRQFGVDNVFSSTVIQDKIKQTLFTKYGVKKSSQIPGFYQKVVKSVGGHPLQMPKAKENARKTFQKRYNASSYWQSETHRQKSQSQDYIRNRHETMKRNGTYRKSGPEDRFFEALIIKFPNTQRQIYVNGWSIDFYIPEINTYVQLDGVYWHGLDRPKKIIEESISPRDMVILSTIERDKRQNEWFEQNKIRLLRFTDKDEIDDIVQELTHLSYYDALP